MKHSVYKRGGDSIVWGYKMSVKQVETTELAQCASEGWKRHPQEVIDEVEAAYLAKFSNKSGSAGSQSKSDSDANGDDQGGSDEQGGGNDDDDQHIPEEGGHNLELAEPVTGHGNVGAGEGVQPVAAHAQEREQEAQEEIQQAEEYQSGDQAEEVQQEAAEAQPEEEKKASSRGRRQAKGK